MPTAKIFLSTALEALMTRTGSRTNPRDRIGTRKDRGLLTCMGEMHRQKKTQKSFEKRAEVLEYIFSPFLGIRRSGGLG